MLLVLAEPLFQFRFRSGFMDRSVAFIGIAKKLGLGDPTSPLRLPTDRDHQVLALRPLTEILVPAHAQES